MNTRPPAKSGQRNTSPHSRSDTDTKTPGSASQHPSVVKRDIAADLEVLRRKIADAADSSHQATCENITEAYRQARLIAKEERRFKAFCALEETRKLKRRPKTAAQTLRAVLQLTFQNRKLASAHFKRVEPLWLESAAVEKVRQDLLKRGSSGKKGVGQRQHETNDQVIHLRISKATLAAHQAGAELGISAIAHLDQKQKCREVEVVCVTSLD